MVEMNYQKVQIYALTYFNNNPTLLYKLSHNFQRCLINIKVKT